MPTSRPRIMLSIDPETKAELDRFAAATGTPASTFISQLLDEARPMLRQLASAAEAAKQQRAEAMDMLLAPLEHAASGIEQAKLELHEKRKRRHPKKKAA